MLMMSQLYYIPLTKMDLFFFQLIIPKVAVKAIWNIKWYMLYYYKPYVFKVANSSANVCKRIPNMRVSPGETRAIWSSN